MAKVLTIQCGDAINRWLNTKFTVVSLRTASKINDVPEHYDFLDGVDCVVFGGGLDVNPDHYGQTKHPLTTLAQGDLDRDTDEVLLYWEAVGRKIPCVGICRGAQLLATQQGASLFQHVTGHTNYHLISTHDKRTFTATSTHHQMIDLRKVPKNNYRMLAWADQVSDTIEYMSPNKVIVMVQGRILEPEVVYFPDDDTLGIQGHPEFEAANNAYSEYCMTQIENTIRLNKDKREKEILKVDNPEGDK